MVTECILSGYKMTNATVSFHTFKTTTEEQQLVHITADNVALLPQLSALVSKESTKLFQLKKDNVVFFAKQVDVRLVELKADKIFIVCKIQ